MAEEAKKTCFVIGPIGEDGSPARNNADMVLEYIITPVMTDMGYDVIRADRVTAPGNISDQVIMATIESDVVIADMTGHNPNAFYELAIRHMVAKPVVHLLKYGEKAPFDVQDNRYVNYHIENPSHHKEAQQRLREQIEAINAPGYEPSNPITRARGYASLSHSEDPKDKLIGNMMAGLTRALAEIEVLKNNPAVMDGQKHRDMLDHLYGHARHGLSSGDLDPDDPTGLINNPGLFSNHIGIFSAKQLARDARAKGSGFTDVSGGSSIDPPPDDK